MTGLYDWNPMPHAVAVLCSSCGEEAEFEFAEIVKISLRQDVEYFQKSAVFEYDFFEARSGSRWHAAIFYPGLNGGTETIRDLPEGYTRSAWSHSKYLYRSPSTDRGSIKCRSCFSQGKSHLKWPHDAYYKIEYKNNELWAFNRECALALRDFIASDERNEGSHKWSSFLLHVPSEFKARGARTAIVKRMNKILGAE